MSSQTLDELWSSAEKRFQERTKKTLRNTVRKNLDDVIHDLNARYNGDGDIEKKGRKGRVPVVVKDVLVFIKLLTGIAANGAAQISGVGDLCFNAVAFLLDAPARVDRLWDGLEALFEEIACFLKEFKIYRRIEEFDRIDAELLEATHTVLICFVDICALSIQILGSSKWTKAKVVAKKVLFDDDSGVASELDHFRNLVRHQSKISDAITLEPRETHVMQAVVSIV